MCSALHKEFNSRLADKERGWKPQTLRVRGPVFSITSLELDTAILTKDTARIPL